LPHTSLADIVTSLLCLPAS